MRSPARVASILLSVLVLIQILWWAYLIVSQQHLIAELINTPEAGSKDYQYTIMIASEGIFFVCVLLMGLRLTHQSLKKELALKQNQSDFLSAVTHELKTPLTNVRLCLDTLERKDLSPENHEKYVRRAQGAVNHLLDEIETILIVSNKGLSAREPDVFDLNDLIEATVKSASQDLEALGRHIEICFEKTPNLQIKAPFHECQLIVRNLLDNALKYSQPTDKTARISIRTARDSKYAISEIMDEGIGLTSEEISHAFDPFFRGEEGRKLSPSGTGLGLSLVKRIADAFGITIRLSSLGKGLGTTVSVRWPLQEQQHV